MHSPRREFLCPIDSPFSCMTENFACSAEPLPPLRRTRRFAIISLALKSVSLFSKLLRNLCHINIIAACIFTDGSSMRLTTLSRRFMILIKSPNVLVPRRCAKKQDKLHGGPDMQ